MATTHGEWRDSTGQLYAKRDNANWHTGRGSIFFYDQRNPNYEFTNFYQRSNGRPLFTDAQGKQWLSSEHYFQAQKYTNQNVREYMRTSLPDARAVFDFAQAVKNKHYNPRFDRKAFDDAVASFDTNWNMGHADQAMWQANWYKYTQNPDLEKQLLATSDKTLVEDSERDDIWGIGPNGTGTNKLGRILTGVRAKLPGRTNNNLPSLTIANLPQPYPQGSFTPVPRGRKHQAGPSFTEQGPGPQQGPAKSTDEFLFDHGERRDEFYFDNGERRDQFFIEGDEEEIIVRPAPQDGARGFVPHPTKVLNFMPEFMKYLKENGYQEKVEKDNHIFTKNEDEKPSIICKMVTNNGIPEPKITYKNASEEDIREIITGIAQSLEKTHQKNGVPFDIHNFQINFIAANEEDKLRIEKICSDLGIGYAGSARPTPPSVPKPPIPSLSDLAPRL